MTVTSSTTAPAAARRLGLHAKLWGAFAVLIAGTIAIGAFGLSSMRRTQDVVREIVDDRWVRARTSHEATSLVNANLESRLTLFLVSDSAGRAELLAEQARQSARITGYFDRIVGALQPGEERALFDTIQQRRTRYLDAFTGARTLLMAGRREEAAAVVTRTVLPKANDYLAAWLAFDDYQSRRVDAAATAGRSAYDRGRRGAISAILLATLLALLFAALVSRSIRGPIAGLQAAAQRIADGDLAHTLDYHSDDELGALADAFRRMAESLRNVLGAIDATATRLAVTASDVAASSEELTASADEVAHAAQTLAGATSEQTSEIDAVAATAAQAAERAGAVSSQAELLQRTTTAAAGAAKRGTEAASSALASMAAIGAASREAAPLVAELARKTEAIGAVTETVETLARQSNLLALNAAIEAARAGEHGRGFAVVAEEVKKLAEQSARSLTDIFRLVAEVRLAASRTEEQVTAVGSSVSTGEQVIRASAESLAAITTEVESSRTAVAHIATLAAAQRTHAAALAHHAARATEPAGTIAATAEEVSAAVEEQTASMEHLAQTGQELAATAERLTAITSRFRLTAETPA